MLKQIITVLVVTFVMLVAFFFTLNVSSENALVNAIIAAMVIAWMCLCMTALVSEEAIALTVSMPACASVAIAVAFGVAENWAGIGFSAFWALALLAIAVSHAFDFVKEQKLNKIAVLALMLVQLIITLWPMLHIICNHLPTTSPQC